MTLFNRRTLLRGTMNGAAVAVGLPLLDMFLDGNGEALAAGAPLPVRFGTWFWGLGVNPQRWYPDKVGADYDLKIELEPIKAFKQKVNVFSNFTVPLDGKPNIPHRSGGTGIRTGIAVSGGGLPGPTFDVLIGDQIGTRSRFRSLDLSAAVADAQNSLSGRGGGNINPAETSSSAFYTRIFGTGFRDPNSGDFTPDPKVMSRRSVLSAVSEQRQALEARVGAADRQRLDQHFTSLRQLENQLDIELTKPEPLQACSLPKQQPKEWQASADIEKAIVNHNLMADLLVLALACDQTRVFNLSFNSSTLTRVGSSATHHQLTHEEQLDTKLGYQPEVTYFVNKSMEAWAYFLNALDGVKEGDRTLLDNMLVFAHSETEFAKFHTVDNIPMMTAGSAGGKVKTGLHVPGKGTQASRLGLTMQQLFGVATDKWGTGSLQTNKTVSEIVA